MVSPVSQCSFLKRNDSMQFSCGYGCSTPMIGIMPQNGNDHSAVTLNAHNQDEISVFKANKLMMEFREIGHLGQGNFGKALLVEENATGHYFVIKVSAPMMSSREEQRLKQERNILFAIRGTPHCATLYDSWAEGTSNSNRHLYLKMHWYERGSVTNAAIERRNIKTAMLREYEKKKTGQKMEILKNMAMEYGENVNEVSEEELLLKAVTQKTSWSEKEVLIFVGQMAIALDAIHSVNIVHVDFKPDNVFIDASGNYFLGDFGCALTLDEKTQKPLSVGNNFLMTSSQNGKFSGLGSAFDRANMTSSDTADDAQFPLMTPPLHGVNPRNSSINQTLDGFPNMPLHMKPSNLSMLPSGCGTEERRESMNNVTGTSLFDTLRTSTGNSNSGPSVSQSLASQDEGDCRYVALDMINKKDNYKAGDIFSFGMSLYELMVGEEPPRNGQKFEQMRKRTDLNELLERGYSPELVALVLPMLNPDPYMRPTAREILRSPLLQPTADTLVALSNVGHIIDTCLPSVLPAKYMKSFLPSTVPVGSPSFSPTSTQMMSNCLNGNTANNGSSTSFFPAATPTNSSPDWLDTTAIGQSDIALKHHSTDRCLMRSPITSLVQGSTNITNDESFISPVQLSADQQSLVPDQSVASEITLLSPLNACDDTIEPFYTTPLHEKSASPIVSGVKQTLLLHNRVLSDSQPMSRPPNELLSEAGQLELRYHKTCMEIAHYTMELLNRATSGVIPPARARFVKWVQEKEFRKVRLKSGNRVGSAKGHTPSVGKPPRPSPKPMRGKGNHNKYKSESQIESVGCTPMQQASVHMSNTSLTTPPTTTTKDERCLSAFQTPNAHIKSRRSR